MFYAVSICKYLVLFLTDMVKIGYYGQIYSVLGVDLSVNLVISLLGETRGIIMFLEDAWYGVKCGRAAPPASHLIEHMAGWH